MDILHSRVADDPDWGKQVTALREACHRPRLVNRWPLPDLAASALRRALAGHTGAVTAVAVAPDGSWLASGGEDEDGADLGRGHRAGTGHLPRPRQPGERGGGGAGWQLAGLRRLGRHGADLGRGHRAGTGHPRTATPARWRRWRWRRMAAGWPPAATTRRCGSGTWPPGGERATPRRPRRLGDGGGGGAGWQLAGLRQRRRDGADLGRGHRAGTGHPHGHAGRGDGGGGGAGWQLAGLRQRGRDGADLGRGHRAATGHPRRPHRLGCRRWRWRRMAAGWPPAARTGRCGSGMRPPGGNGPPSTGHASP